MRSKYLILIPTYNEKKNINLILGKINKKFNQKHDILFVDDNSNDGTKEIINGINTKNISVINRKQKLGVGSAHKVGIIYGYKKKYDYIITMDCDGTHDPKYLKKMVELSKKCDLVITNRFRSKNSLKNWNFFRKFITTFRYKFIKFLLNIDLDSSGAFRCYNTKKINLTDILLSKNNSYSFFSESIILLSLKKYKISELPVILPKRFSGSSKMKLTDLINGFFYTIFIFIKVKIFFY